MGVIDVTEEEVEVKHKKKAKGGRSSPKAVKGKEQRRHYKKGARKFHRVDRDTRKELADLYMSTLRRH